jgi:16S rRNA (adenine1518-N6/adenine1519-N6)-dimethyltransferase
MTPDRPKLTRPSEVRAWIDRQQFMPSKVLGQNFLIDENILTIMLAETDLAPTDRILEVGPGLGILTEPLAARCERLVAIEKDTRLAGYLEPVIAATPNLRLIVADALKVPLGPLQKEERLNKFVSNLPYSVGSRVLVEAFLLPDGFDRMVVTVQLEVGERLAARPDTSEYGLLGIWAQVDYDVRVAKRIAPSCFHPRPQVTSAIVTLVRKHHRRAALTAPALFDALLKHAFSRRRKQLGTILESFPQAGGRDRLRATLATLGIDPKVRPETLDIPTWLALANALAPLKPTP